MGEVMIHSLDDYQLKLTKRRKQSTSKLNLILLVNHKYVNEEYKFCLCYRIFIRTWFTATEQQYHNGATS